MIKKKGERAMEVYHKVFNRSCIISEARDQRPFVSENDIKCPFCLGNEESLQQIINEKWEKDELLIRIVPNRYPMTSQKGARGIHDVIIDTHHHTLHPKDFRAQHWEVLLHTIQERWHSIMNMPFIRFIQVFKNYGEAAGASITHSHWQLVALESLPYTMKVQYDMYKSAPNTTCYLCDMSYQKEGIVILDEVLWKVWVPPVSQFPYEVWLIPKQHHQHYGELSLLEINVLGKLIKDLLQVYHELAPGYAFNICFMSGDLKGEHPYHFHIKLMLRIGKIAGFEIATGCHILSIAPQVYAQQLKKCLKGMYQ